MDSDAAELLEGLEGPAREARAQLVEMLLDQGFSPAEMKRAAAEDRLALLPVARVLGGRFTAAEVEQASGVPAKLVQRIRRLGGLSQAGEHDRVFSDDDIAMARSIKLFLDAGIELGALEETTRVTGEAMARIAATVSASFAGSFLQENDSEDAVAVRFAALAEQLTPALQPVLTAAFRSHLSESIGRGMIGHAQLASGHIADTVELAVAFADLVGFTRLGGEIEVAELGGVAGRLAELAAESAAPPVRLVKTIGDAAMFVSPDPGALVAAALTLVEGAAAADLPALRVGIALGPAVQRAGDYYGNAVNLASRVTGAARPNSVLCTQEVRDGAGDTFDFSGAGAFRLKGVSGQVPLHRVRSAASEPDAAARRSSRSRRPKEDRSRRRESR